LAQVTLSYMGTQLDNQFTARLNSYNHQLETTCPVEVNSSSLI